MTLNREEACPSCGKPAAIESYPHTVRRQDRAVGLRWHRYVCHEGCSSERDGGSLSFVTEAVGENDRAAAEGAWREKYGEAIPAPRTAGRPQRAGSPSSERVPVLFTREELREIDRRRGDLSRSAFVRQAAVGRR
jgi:hypothetical protein